MRTLRSIVLGLVILALLAACVSPTPTPQPTATIPPTPAIIPTTIAEPTSPPPMPTAEERAPEATFTSVGNTAELHGEQGISGKAVVAGLQTLIIQGFHFDGKGPRADVRLAKGGNYQNPTAILLTLESRAYANELLYMRIPAAAGSDTVDEIVIYVPETGKVLATGVFR